MKTQHSYVRYGKFYQFTLIFLFLLSGILLKGQSTEVSEFVCQFIEYPAEGPENSGCQNGPQDAENGLRHT